MGIRTLAGFLGVMVALCLAPAARGDDVVVPDWRGDPGSTVQEWDFLNSDNPAAPTNATNPYGSASDTIVIGFLGEGYMDDYEGRDGVWDIAAGSMTLWIPNSSVTGPGTYKDLLVQVTYYKDISDAPTVSIDGASLVDSGSQQRGGVTPLGGYWYLDWTLWRLEPNPLNEDVVINGNASWGSVIDQVVVDTVCVPEPATLTLLALSMAALVARRRRRA